MKILIADDSPICRHLLKQVLESWNYDVVEACDGCEAWKILQSDSTPRLAILDWYMPGIDGTTICRRLRERTGHYCYALLLTSNNDRDGLISGLKAGADDFLSKPFDPAELEQRLWAGVRIIELQDRLLAVQEELQMRATHDVLTDTWNRRAIIEILERELNRSFREGRPLGVVMADVDHFKRINDTYGHQAGDDVLKSTMTRLKCKLRPYDSIGRYGGEEFLAVLPNTGVDGAMVLAERLRQCMVAEPIRTRESALNVTLSLGVAVAEVPSGLTVETIIRQADSALYAAKESGRNRVCPAAHPGANLVEIG